jgi:hypothetical protein
MGTLAGSDEQEITGGRGSFTVNLAVQEATPYSLPSLMLTVTWWEPDCNPVVSTCVEAAVSPTFTPEPLQLYLTVRLGLKLDPSAVAVTGSPAKTSVGCTEQVALGGVTVRSPPHINTMPAWSLMPLTLVLAVVDEGPYRAVSHSAQYFATKKTNLSVAGRNRGRVPPAKRSEMHRDDLMNPDLLSEIVLLGSATLIFITLLAIVVTAFSRVAAL